MTDYYLDIGLAQPAATPLDEPYWSGLRENICRVQRCASCGGWQWGPEWICHHCLSDDVGFVEVEPRGVIYSYERVWHPVHPALSDNGPYIVVLVELPDAGNVRMVGNLLGDPQQTVQIGAAVEGVYEHHDDVEVPFTLLQWRVVLTRSQ
ncbi:MAG: OB-fold domain-containing protein [Pseudomonadota bacterium]